MGNKESVSKFAITRTTAKNNTITHYVNAKDAVKVIFEMAILSGVEVVIKTGRTRFVIPPEQLENARRDIIN